MTTSLILSYESRQKLSVLQGLNKEWIVSDPVENGSVLYTAVSSKSAVRGWNFIPCSDFEHWARNANIQFPTHNICSAHCKNGVVLQKRRYSDFVSRAYLFKHEGITPTLAGLSLTQSWNLIYRVRRNPASENGFLKSSKYRDHRTSNLWNNRPLERGDILSGGYLCQWPFRLKHPSSTERRMRRPLATGTHRPLIETEKTR